MNALLIPIVLFVIVRFLDKYITFKSVKTDGSNEANPVTRFVLKRYGKGVYLLSSLIFTILIILIALFLPLFFALWLLYTAFLGHLIGFLSWTKWNKWKGQKMNWDKAFLLLVVIFISFGYMLATFHASLL